MYEDYWQLATQPFDLHADTRFHFPQETQQAALLKLRYTIDNHRSAALLAGPSGVGKSLLIELLRQQLDESVGSFITVVFPLMSSRDLLAYLADQIGAPAADPPQLTIEESLRRLSFALQEHYRRNQHTVVVVDEAHLLEDSGLLETLRLLLNLQTEGRPALTLLLAGQPGILSALNRNAALDERLDIKILLKPFTSQETADYIAHRLHAAHASRQLFTDEAVHRIHQLTGGVPRQINRLCELALVVGYAARQPTIDVAQIQSVSDELITLTAAA